MVRNRRRWPPGTTQNDNVTFLPLEGRHGGAPDGRGELEGFRLVKPILLIVVRQYNDPATVDALTQQVGDDSNHQLGLAHITLGGR